MTGMLSLLRLWALLIVTTFAPCATFVYAHDIQTKFNYDDSSEYAVGCDAISVLTTGEEESGVAGNRVLFGKFAEFVAARGADNVANGLRLRNQLAGQEIAGGHAFGKHAAEFGFKTPAQMASHVESVMTNPSAVRNLSRGRTAYWDDASQSVVIRNPSAADGGTVFKPTNGRAYFDNLQ